MKTFPANPLINNGRGLEKPSNPRRRAKELNELIFSGTLNEAVGDPQAILRTPLGLRIQKLDGGKQCTCLCHSETEGLFDIEVTVSADGRAYEVVRTVLREPECRTLY